jgi:hypothetical protein
MTTGFAIFAVLIVLYAALAVKWPSSDFRRPAGRLTG